MTQSTAAVKEIDEIFVGIEIFVTVVVVYINLNFRVFKNVISG